MTEFINLYEKLKTTVEEGKFTYVVFFCSLLTLAFFAQGQSIIPLGVEVEKIIEIAAVILLFTTTLMMLISTWVNKYKTSELSQPMETKVGFDFLNQILLNGMNRKKFQYLGVYQIDGSNSEVICDRSSKSDFQKEFANNKMEILETIYSQNRVVLSDNCTKIANFQITHLL
jgi:hypothetical protein